MGIVKQPMAVPARRTAPYPDPYNSGFDKRHKPALTGFTAGVADAHHLINRSGKPATYLEVGTRSRDNVVTYPDIDLTGIKQAGQYRFQRKNGDPYP